MLCPTLNRRFVPRADSRSQRVPFTASTEGMLCAMRAAQDRLAMGFYCHLNGFAVVPTPCQGAQRCTAGAGAVGGAGFTTP
jgi:hypothetical protein